MGWFFNTEPDIHSWHSIFWRSKDENYIIRQIQSALENGLPLNKSDANNHPPLFWAVDEGLYNAAKYLIEAGADVNHRHYYGEYTPIVSAITRGDTDMIDLLLEAGADLNARNVCGVTTVMYAAMNNLYSLKKLIDLGADCNLTDEDGRTALGYAVQEKNIVTAVCLLPECNFDVYGNINALTHAATDESLSDIIKSYQELVSLDEDTMRRINGEILMAAIAGSNYKIVESILNAGELDLDFHSNRIAVNTPLTFAAELGDVTSVEYLLKAGVDIDMKEDGFEKTALMQAAEDGHLQVVELLLEAGADPNLQNRYGNTVLMRALDRNHPDIAMVLLQNGAEVNTQDKLGMTPLMAATEKGYNDVVKKILDIGVDMNVKNLQGIRAREMAISCEQWETAGILEDALKNGKSLTPDEAEERSKIMAQNTRELCRAKRIVYQHKALKFHTEQVCKRGLLPSEYPMLQRFQNHMLQRS